MSAPPQAGTAESADPPRTRPKTALVRWARRSDVRFGDVKTAGALIFGFDTSAGPLYLAWGHTYRGHSSFILLLGGPSQRN